MGYSNKQLLPGCIYFVTTVTDQRRKIFKKDACSKIFLENLKFYRKRFQYYLLGYVIVPDHVHLLIMTGKKGTISQIMHGIKGYTSLQINKILNTPGNANWQDNFYPSIVDEEDQFYVKLDYIHANPVKHGYVKYQDEWKYSSYRNYYLNDESLIKIDRLNEVEII